MSSSEDFGTPFPDLEHWYLDLCMSSSSYGQEENFVGQHGQAQAQYDCEYNLSLEPDDLELDSNSLVSSNTLAKRHTMPVLGASQHSPSTNIKDTAQLVSNSPKRAETYPTTLEGPNVSRQQRLREFLSKIDPGTASTAPESDSQASDATNVAQSLHVDPFAGEIEWPVPTFLLDLIDGPSPPGLDRTDELTPDELASPSPFNHQSQDIEHTQTNDCYSMEEDLVSAPPLSFPYHKATLNSDSGIGSSIMPSQNGGKSSIGGSQAKKSVMFDKGSISGGVAHGFYQKAAAMGPLKTPASYTAPSVATKPILSETALQTIKEIILDPILNDTKFRDFWHICSMAWEQMVAGQIGSLRDLEKFLFHKASNQQNNRAYDIFCKEFLSHVRESLKYMPENELLRSYDRPYDTGYWLDIMSQFSKSSIVMGISQDSDEEFEFQRWLDSTKSQPTKSQPTKSQLGKRAADAHTDDSSLVKRVKPNVPAITAVNGRMPLGYEHSAINNLRDDITISQPRDLGLMGPPPLPASVRKSVHPPITAPLVKSGKARTRRRGSGQQQKEQLLYRCEWDNCQHEPFTRACDLTKHQKTHTRPHKCEFVGCKYAIQGFPTEKERDRHWDDKHSSAIPSYSCLYPPCTYKSKRDSNCKQHMEKAHGYTYVRMKQNYKTSSHKRQNATPTSPASQGSPTGSSPAKPDSSITNASQRGMVFQTIASQASTMPELCSGGMKEQLYSVNDVEKLRSYLAQHNQPNAHGSDLMNNFGHQEFTHSGMLPYPDIGDPDYYNYLSMPDSDSNIDPSLFMNGAMTLDAREEQGLTPYTDSNTVT